jgi:hypothetical protein
MSRGWRCCSPGCGISGTEQRKGSEVLAEAVLSFEVREGISREILQPAIEGVDGILGLERSQAHGTTVHDLDGKLRSRRPKNSIPVALRFTGPLDLTVLRRSLTEIVRRHESLRTSFRWEGGEAHLVISDGWSIQVLQSELTLLYAAFAKGRPSPLMSTIARNFETLLARITADPDVRLSRLREMVQENA